MSYSIENLSKFSWLFEFNNIDKKNSSHHKMFSILIELLFISDRTDIIRLIIQESIKSFTVFVMRDCWMLILFTILIILIVRLIIIINELAILIIAVFLLFEFFFECLHRVVMRNFPCLLKFLTAWNEKFSGKFFFISHSWKFPSFYK